MLTGNDGAFHLSTTIGAYVLAVEHSGYRLANVLLGSDPSDMVVSLQPLSAQTHPAAATLVSTHELSVPAKAKAAFEKGSALAGKSPPDYEGAIHEFHRAIKQFPSYYEAYGEMSIAQFRAGDLKAAEDSLQKSIDLSGGHYVKGMVLMAELLNSRGRFADAAVMAQQAIAVDELSAAAHCQLARALSGLKRPAEAAVSANRALQLEPRNPMFSLVLGNIHLQQHDFAAAVHDFDAYLQQLPTGPQSDLVRTARNRAQGVLDSSRTQAISRP